MTTVEGTPPGRATLPVAALILGAGSVVAWLVPGVSGMITSGILGTLAILLGASSLLVSRDKSARTVRMTAMIAVLLGLVGLAGLWVTAALVVTIPG